MAETTTIIGAGLAGLSAAITLAEAGRRCRLVSVQDARRSQSVMAEGGINGALDTMGDADSPDEHFADTMAGGVWLADPNAVWGLTHEAPALLRRLHALGMPFNLHNGRIQQRYFGGQKKRRTAFAMSSTGKMLVETLNDECRKYEAAGLVECLFNHEFVGLLLDEGAGETGAPTRHGEASTSAQHGTAAPTTSLVCKGVRVRNTYTGEVLDCAGPVILASGGMNGLFYGRTTGTVQNTGDVTAIAFAQGVVCGNLEMVQYHPTTISIPGKRCLVSEAARGEGGRLYVLRDGQPWYFMEERYPELGNLMPRDVVSREEYSVVREEGCGEQVYLDLTGISQKAWRDKLDDLRTEIEHYLKIDPAETPVPIEPGIHYFMGGIRVDERHRTNVAGLLAAGECCCQYHGANRLGGNSTLGAIYGGRVAAQTLIAGEAVAAAPLAPAGTDAHNARPACQPVSPDAFLEPASIGLDQQLSDLLFEGLGIVRDEEGMRRALAAVQTMKAQTAAAGRPARDLALLSLAEAMCLSGLARRESRGAHYRSDFPRRDDEGFQKQTMARVDGSGVQVGFAAIPERRGGDCHAATL